MHLYISNMNEWLSNVRIYLCLLIWRIFFSWFDAFDSLRIAKSNATYIFNLLKQILMFFFFRFLFLKINVLSFPSSVITHERGNYCTQIAFLFPVVSFVSALYSSWTSCSLFLFSEFKRVGSFYYYYYGCILQTLRLYANFPHIFVFPPFLRICTVTGTLDVRAASFFGFSFSFPASFGGAYFLSGPSICDGWM